MWKMCFSAFQNAKKENQFKHKNQVRSRNFIDSYVFDYKGLYISLRGENKRQTFTLISLKIMRIWKYLVYN